MIRVDLPPCPSVNAVIEARIADDGGPANLRWTPAEPLIGLPRWRSPSRSGLDEWATIVASAIRHGWLLDVVVGEAQEVPTR